VPQTGGARLLHSGSDRAPKTDESVGRTVGQRPKKLIGEIAAASLDRSTKPSTLTPASIELAALKASEFAAETLHRCRSAQALQPVCIGLIAGIPKPDTAIPPCVLPYEAFRFDLPRIATDEHPLERSMLATSSG
jgi:hypothetical protein